MVDKKDKVFTTKQLGLDNLRDLGLDQSTLILNKKKYKFNDGVKNAE
jgi:uncharacterized protein YkvS